MSFQQDPFDAPPRTRHPPRSRRQAGERLHGGQHLPRHQGVPHDAHSRHPGGGPGLEHPHQHALGTGAPSGQRSAPAGSGPHRSRVHLAARAGLQKIEVGSIQPYNAAANTALVRVLGAQANLLGPLPLAEGIAPDLAVAGAGCLVVLLDEANPSDAAIVAIYSGPPAPWVQAGAASLALSSYQLATTVTFPVPFTSGVPAVSACSRDPTFVASVSGEALSGFVLTLTRREGATQLQAGTANVVVGAGSGSGSATAIFPVAFAVARTVVATSTVGSWVAGVSAPSTGGCTLTLTGVNGAVGPITVTVHWHATGDPAVSATVLVDWLAVGT